MIAIIKDIFPEHVATHICPVLNNANALFPEEKAIVEKAIDKRRFEFATGRHCARECLKQLGITPCAIPRTPDGMPAWPTGTIGAITHSHDYAAAVVAHRSMVESLGVDIERTDRLTNSLSERILTDHEAKWIEQQTPYTGDLPSLFFSAKESVYKCIYPHARQWINFKDVHIVPNLETRSFSAQPTSSDCSFWPSQEKLTGRFAFFETSILTGIVLRT